MKAQNSSLAHQDMQSFETMTDSSTRTQAAVVTAGHERTGTTRSSSRRRPDRAQRDAANPFGPDVILPEQFYDQRNGAEQAAGEKALMLAVLEDGIRCFQEHLKNPRVRPRLLARQAEKWIRSADWDWPFSFNNVCESLSLNPECLRSRLLAPRASGEAAPKPRPSSHRVYRLTPRVKPPRRR